MKIAKLMTIAERRPTNVDQRMIDQQTVD